MKRTSPSRWVVPGVAALVTGLTLAACAAGNEAESGHGTEASPAVAGLSGTLSGGGASSQEAAQNAWRAGFQEAHPEVTVNYDPIGSGGGREQFISGSFPFAGSDAYLTDHEGELGEVTERCHGQHPIEIPNYVSPIAIVHNVEDVEELNLSPETLAAIFDDAITRWNDPAIAEDNPDADLPDANITAVHRSDDSGTTENLTDYLSAAAGDAWSHGPVETWPIPAGEAGQGTFGVISAVRNGANTIGYADASQAGDLGVAHIKVGDDYVGPTAEAAAKILEVSPRVEDRPESDMAFDLDHLTEESAAYPIVLTSYLMACPTYEDEQTAELVKGYLGYILSEEGQQTAAENAGSAALSDELAGQGRGIVDGIKAG